MFARSRSFDHLVRELLGKCGGDACAARARRFDPSLRFELFIDKHDRLAINAHGHGEFAAAGQKSAGSEAPALNVADHTVNDVHPQRLLPRVWRSEERRVGKECVSTCRYRWLPYNEKQKYK